MTISFNKINAPYLEVNYLAVEKRAVKLHMNHKISITTVTTQLYRHAQCEKIIPLQTMIELSTENF
jgi:hypothetical protein